MPNVPGFLPSSRGFSFNNSWPSVPLRIIDFGLVQVPIGDASNGLCGGMAFAIRDMFQAGVLPPPTRPNSSDPLFTFIVDRLFDSFNLPGGPARYYYLMNPSLPDHETWMSRAGLAPHGRAWIMIKEEWPKIKADLDAGRLCPLGLIQVKSADPLEMGKNHQVLAYGYNLNGTYLTMRIYDPNFPRDDAVTLSLDIGNPYNTRDVRHNRYNAPKDVYCFFRPDYFFRQPPRSVVVSPSSWTDVKRIPGWFGTENQGGGLTAGDITGNGQPDLVAFHIDNPAGENAGYYRLGRNLDAAGNVTGGWTDPKHVPGWFGWENQGGDVALADISGNGQPDLAVFHIDNPGGENAGYYRVGWNLNTNGDVTGGWSDVKRIPGWFGAENQGAGLAIADISGNGRPDMVVFHIDNPSGENTGYYRIGWNLDTSGNVTGGWTDIRRVPGWFGVENQGAGVAVAYIRGSSRPDLVVFHIDNPGGENAGYYRVGSDLDANGNVTGGWSDVKRVPGWFGAENQGVGIALADVNGSGTPDLIVSHIDNPGGENAGYYRVGWNA
ncbi:MAG: hypothetical protein M3Q29_08610 [Chloroflexota bacterium]|nr:hypothetical protein [Chloroflexota bacterium]